ncbi:MAG: NADH-quinone oxidoreductase subunit C [bacterium]
MAVQERVIEIIKEAWGDDILSLQEINHEDILTIKKESKNKLVEICLFLRDNEELKFNALSVVTAVDYLDFPEYPAHDCRFEGVYQMFSMDKHYHLRIKVPIEDDGHPSVPSVYEVWNAAEFHEDEAYDMFGIEYTGHPELRRMFLPYDWIGHPLRKDYGLTEGQDYGINKVKEKMPGAETWKVERDKRFA